jgi:hypothetical protein
MWPLAGLLPASGAVILGTYQVKGLAKASIGKKADTCSRMSAFLFRCPLRKSIARPHQGAFNSDLVIIGGYINKPGKTVSRKARKERKGKSGGYLTLAFNLIGAGL